MRLHALVLERGAAEDRVELAPRRCARRMPATSCSSVGSMALEEQLHHPSSFSARVSIELVAPLASGLGVVGRDVDDVVHLALGRVLAPEQALHLHQVDDAREIGLDAPWQLNDRRGGAQPVTIMSTQRWNSAPTRSILLTKQMRGTL